MKKAKNNWDVTLKVAVIGVVVTLIALLFQEPINKLWDHFISPHETTPPIPHAPTTTGPEHENPAKPGGSDPAPIISGIKNLQSEIDEAATRNANPAPIHTATVTLAFEMPITQSLPDDVINARIALEQRSGNLLENTDVKNLSKEDADKLYDQILDAEFKAGDHDFEAFLKPLSEKGQELHTKLESYIENLSIKVFETKDSKSNEPEFELNSSSKRAELYVATPLSLLLIVHYKAQIETPRPFTSMYNFQRTKVVVRDNTNDDEKYCHPSLIAAEIDNEDGRGLLLGPFTYDGSNAAINVEKWSYTLDPLKWGWMKLNDRRLQ